MCSSMQQQRSRRSLSMFHGVTTITGFGAIPLLVPLLGPGYPEKSRNNAALLLCFLANSADNSSAIGAAGAIPPLARMLLDPGSSTHQRYNAAEVLARLSDNAENAGKIAAAGAIRPLVQLDPETPEDVQFWGCLGLSILAQHAVENAAAIADAGAIPRLVQLLGSCSSVRVQAASAQVLSDLCQTLRSNQLDAVVETAAGAISRLVKLLRRDSISEVPLVVALGALGLLADLGQSYI
jgi:hypothetical protein